MPESGEPIVSIREHLEALASERESRLQKMFKAHQAVHEQEATVRAEAARRIDYRLEGLNELRAEVLTDRARFVNRETFDIKTKEIDRRIDALHDQITEWKGQRQGLSLLGSLALGAATFITAILAVYFALTS